MDEQFLPRDGSSSGFHRENGIFKNTFVVNFQNYFVSSPLNKPYVTIKLFFFYQQISTFGYKPLIYLSIVYYTKLTDVQGPLNHYRKPIETILRGTSLLTKPYDEISTQPL